MSENETNEPEASSEPEKDDQRIIAPGPDNPHDPRFSTKKRPLLANPYFWGAIAGIVAMTAIRPLLQKIPAPPPVIGQVPDFSLVDHDGKKVTLADLRGKVWVADFFFVRCPSICPRLTKSMLKLQKRYQRMATSFKRNGLDIKLLSFTVDPENDRPETLRAYAKKYGADLGRWRFFTTADKTQSKAMRDLLVEGFGTHVGSAKKINGVMDIAHMASFVIIDRNGGIRGFYPTDTKDGIEEIFHRSIHVAMEKD